MGDRRIKHGDRGINQEDKIGTGYQMDLGDKTGR
jgi:hypothetical protein